MSDHPDSDLREKVLFVEDWEAQRKFEIYKSRDPFPEIVPALLNSADIYDYVAATGMIAPFYTKDLKSASYEIGILGTVIYWDENGEENFLNLRQGKEFILKRNSIAFVTPESKFRLPDYIALRFNLRITHVHRGVLLGTGPLVDPGFEGNLLIPLHNLTTNDYKFKGGDPLIWVEFTKLSPNKRWDNSQLYSSSERIGKYEPFPDKKKNLAAEYYLSKASPHSPIRSSIPDTLESARRSAQEAEEKAKSIARNVTWAGVGSVVALVVSLSFGLYQVVSLIQDSNGYVKGAQSELHTFQRKFDQQGEFFNNEFEKVKLLEREIQELRKQVSDLSKSLDEYKVSREAQTQKNVSGQ
jgi:deoxycytidine triphosphate deaminase